MTISDDSLARRQSAAPSGVEPDYDAIHATIVSSGTGRWFLAEYARRYRGADTDLVLAAIERIEQAVGHDTAAERVRPELTDPIQAELGAMAEAIRQTRAEVVGRGDPAASGEAAVIEFRNAVEQIQELVLAVQGREGASDHGAQMSFQTNRLAGAGDRLERSMASLRTLLGLLDDFDQRLRRLVQVPEWIGNFFGEPEATQHRPDSPQAVAQESPRSTIAEQGESLWAMTEAQRDVPPVPESPAADRPMSAMERLEAREYGQRIPAMADAAPEPSETLSSIVAPETPAYLRDDVESPAPARATARDPLFDFQAPLPARPAHPELTQEPAMGESPPSGEGRAADTPSAAQRLESVRSAIAALMDEVSEKTARRNPRQS